jgi:Lar family restriction alleviation protein
MPDLKPCPFCGSDKVSVSENDGGWPRWVDCDECESMGPTAHPKMNHEQALAFVVAGWNRRAKVKCVHELAREFLRSSDEGLPKLADLMGLFKDSPVRIGEGWDETAPANADDESA